MGSNVVQAGFGHTSLPVGMLHARGIVTTRHGYQPGSLAAAAMAALVDRNAAETRAESVSAWVA